MRIKKPKGQQVEYKIYSNIEERNTASGKMLNGQEVKVLDASDDENIGSGWAIYKYDKERNLFDLLEKEEQPVIPEFPTVFEPDYVSVESNRNNNQLTAPDALVTMRTDVRILEDFDYSIRPLGQNLYLEPIGGQRTIKVEMNGVVRYLSLSSQQINFLGFENGGKGKRVHWALWGKVNDTDILATNMSYATHTDGSVHTITPISSDVQVLLMQVSASVHNTGTIKPELIRIHKYWKKHLVPVEERIPTAEPLPEFDNETVSSKLGTADKINAPALQHPFYDDIRIMKDFDLQVTADPTTKNVNITINGSSDMVSIPINTPSGMKYLKLIGHTITSTWLHANSMADKTAYVNVSGYIKDTDEETISNMQQTMQSSGAVYHNATRDVITDGVFPVVQVAIKVPKYSFWNFNGTMVKAFKYYKQILAPAEERITVPAGSETLTDDYSTYKDIISEKESLVVPSAYFSTTNDFRILEDFDYTIEQGYQGNSVVFSPVGGARNIPVLVGGVKKYMSINTEGVLFNLFGGSGKGRYNHIEIAATIRDNDDAVSNMTTYYNSGGEILLTKPKSGDTITLFQARIFNPVDVADWDVEKLSMWKYWKKALAPAEERMGVDWYGVSKDMSSEFPVCTRIGNMDLHRSLPVQSKMKRCLLWDNGTVHYYLDPNDSTKKTDGTAATLDGSHGQVMVEIPEYYYCYERIGTVCYYKISLSPLEGFKRIQKTYVSAYEAAMQRSNSKLSSLINLDPDFRGGVNKSSDDADALKTGLGRPVGNELRSTLREAGYNRGDNWHMYHVYNHYMLSMLFVIEYSTFNSQLAFNSELNSSGFKQGGLGKGLTDGDSIGHMIAGMTAVVPCGITNSLGNNSGETTFNAVGLAMGTDQELTANSYRGIENPFGHMSKLVDGINSIASHGYVSEAKKGLSDDVIEGFEYVGRLGTGNYITDVMDHILPLPKTASGGSSSTYFCDTTSVNANNSSVSLGGMLSGLDGNGLFRFNAAISTTPITYAGTRLCFAYD